MSSYQDSNVTLVAACKRVLEVVDALKELLDILADSSYGADVIADITKEARKALGGELPGTSIDDSLQKVPGIRAQLREAIAQAKATTIAKILNS